MPELSGNGDPPASAADPQPINGAEAYGVRLLPVEGAFVGGYWRVNRIRALAADEAQGKRNLYVRVLDEQGARARNPLLRVAYTWEGRRDDEAAPPRPLDKPEAERGHAEIELNAGQHIELWIEGDNLPSEHVANLHADPGAHAFLIIFQRTQAPPAPVEPQGTDDAHYVREEDNVPDGTQLEAGQRFVKRWIVRNSGTTTWGDGYRLRRVSGPALGTPSAIPVPPTAPGREATISVEFVADAEAGPVRSEWRLTSPRTVDFGQRLWTEIVISGGRPTKPAASFPPPPDQRVQIPEAGIGAEAARFWNRYGGLVLEESARLRIDPVDAMAVLITESSAQPFDADGRMVLRFENHLFWEEWGKQAPERFRQHFQFDPQESWQAHRWRADAQAPWQPCHVDNSQEWEILTFARTLDERGALRSISMGIAQIMGFNHDRIGYATVQTMFHDFQADAGAQLRALFRFMETNDLVETIRQRDYLHFARIYNGEGRPHFYADAMQEYATIFGALLRPAVDTPATVEETYSPDVAEVDAPRLRRRVAWRLLLGAALLALAMLWAWAGFNIAAWVAAVLGVLVLGYAAIRR